MSRSVAFAAELPSEDRYHFASRAVRHSLKFNWGDAKQSGIVMMLSTSATVCESPPPGPSSATWKNRRVSVRRGRNGGKCPVKQSIENSGEDSPAP